MSHLKPPPVMAEKGPVSGMTITAAIVAALVAVTLLVFAGGGGGEKPVREDTSSSNPVCQTAGGYDCVQAAKDLVNGTSAPAPAEPVVP